MMMRIVGYLAAALLAGVTACGAEPDIQARCAAKLAEWKSRFDEEHFSYLVAPPFILAGDGTRAQLIGYRDRTVLAAAKALKATYFRIEPSEPVVILLFESGESYRRLAKKWFNDDDVPHYGFFRSDNVMLMNVSTGTGTLVHELTHALIKPDFPEVPSWFNEGLASLYEQCSMNGGGIRGLPNWRLPALQRAIKDGKLRPLEQMIADARFYREDLVGLNYAQARYLMLYLQGKGLLAKYYASFRDHKGEDSDGLETLKQIIAPQELPSFEKEWRAWVLTLRFP
jgi:hypothetical protein